MSEEILFPNMGSSVDELQTKQQRRKMFYISDMVVLRVMLAISHNRPSPQVRGLPADCESLSVHYDHLRRAFCFHACSMEWPRLHEAQSVPQVEIEIVDAPADESQFVLWRRLTSALGDDLQTPLSAQEAAELVTSEGWKDGSERIEERIRSDD